MARRKIDNAMAKIKRDNTKPRERQKIQWPGER